MDQATRVALFKYQVIAPLLSPAEPGVTMKRRMRQIAKRIHDHPVRGPVRVAPGTLEEWLAFYRREGLPGLLPKSRKDRGKSRRIPPELAEEIVLLVTERPELDGPGILAETGARLSLKRADLPSLSTLYRFLKAQGLADRRRPRRADHRAFAFDFAGDCWQADVMFGPALPTKAGGRKKTYLFALLDDATRLVPHAQFYFEQHLRSFTDCLRQAFEKRGLPRRLYVDNARIFRSRRILLLGARLGFQIVHTRPYKPQGRAKLERWFGTVRRRFLPRVDVDRLEGIEDLNRLLFTFLEGEYHVTSHRGIQGETPLDRWVRLADGLRPLPTDLDLDRLFLEETTRRVAKDGTLRLKGQVFEAGPVHIGTRVTVRFEPFDLRRILVADGEEWTEAFPVDLAANRRVRRKPDPAPEAGPKKRPLRSLAELADRLEEEDDR